METFDVRARLAEILKEKKISNAALAKSLGCDRRAVTYWTSHQRTISSDLLLSIFDALAVTPNQFFNNETTADSLSRLVQLDKEHLQRKLETIKEQQFLVELALRAKDEDFQKLLMQSLSLQDKDDLS